METTDTAPVAVTGNTYPVKDQLRAMGGRWNPYERAWMMPAARAAEARALVASAGQGQRQQRRRQRQRYGSTLTRFSSGAEVYTNRAGRCEDAPCCGCCS